ncbi:MAG: NADAR family protein [Rhodospirillaceae bacterium]|nr:NADAR family protein [Rhodospirillaceae bacterium]
MTTTIYFYGKTDDYGCFANTSDHGFTVDGRYWRSVEHFYQAHKFADPAWTERIRQARTVREARALGQSRKVLIRADWDSARDAVMVTAVKAKIAAHPEVRRTLLETGEALLVEASPYDHYWGCGADGTGANRLGQILMQIRSELRAGPVEGG